MTRQPEPLWIRIANPVICVVAWLLLVWGFFAIIDIWSR